MIGVFYVKKLPVNAFEKANFICKVLNCPSCSFLNKCGNKEVLIGVSDDLIIFMINNCQ